MKSWYECPLQYIVDGRHRGFHEIEISLDETSLTIY
jgi:hypothetical protein